MVSRSVVRTIDELLFTEYIVRRIWRAVGRIWLWYWDGTNIVYQSRPAGGGSWTSPETVRACDDRANFATWFDGTYFHYAYSRGNVNTPDSSVYYRRGLANADGSITWSATEQTVQGHSSSWRRRRLSICVDDGGYPWINWQRVQRGGTHNYEAYITTSSTKDGTWTTYSGFPFKARDTQSSNYSSIVPMTGGKVMIFTGGASRLFYRIFTQSSMGSSIQISGIQDDNRQWRHNAVAIGDRVYVCYQWGLAAIRFQVYNGSWGAISTPATPADRPGLLAKKDDSTLMLFWETADVILYKQYTISGGSWGSEETFQNETTDTIPSWGVMQASYDGGGRPFLHYATKTGPYDMIFTEWEPPHADLLGEFIINQWQEDLHAEFEIGQGSADLLGTFETQATADLLGKFEAQATADLLGKFESQVTADLLGKFEAQATADMLGRFEVGQNSAELLGKFEVGQGSADLKAVFEGQAIQDLLGEFEVGQGRENLFGGFVVRHSGPVPWLAGWRYLKKHTLTGSVAGAQTDYQLRFEVHYGAGVDAGAVVYCDSQCKADFGDIRFTKADGATELDYWIQQQVNGDVAYIWVEVDTIPVSPNTIGIYMYYGNAAAATTSSFANAWLESDDYSSDPTIARNDASSYSLAYWDITDRALANHRFDFDVYIYAHNFQIYGAIPRVGLVWGTTSLTPLDGVCLPDDTDIVEGNYYLIDDPVGLQNTGVAWIEDDWHVYSLKFDDTFKLTIWRKSTETYVVSDSAAYNAQTVTHMAVQWYAGTGYPGSITYDGVNDWVHARPSRLPGYVYFYIDNFRVGTYCDPEPAHTAWGPETGPGLLAGFEVGQGSADLYAEFEVGQGSADLKAVFEGQVIQDLFGEFEVGQGRENLFSGFIVRQGTSVNLLGEFEVGQGSADLLGRFEAQATAELLGKFEAQVTAELLSHFDVGQGSADLLARFLIPRAYNFSSGMGISFDWWGSGGVDQQIDFEMWSLTGGWVGRFPDGPAEWRQVQLSWDDLTEVDLDGTRPDSSQIIGIYWTYHTPGIRRIDGIRAWMRQDLLCKVVIRNASAAPDLLGKFKTQATAELLGKGFVKTTSSAELFGSAEVGQGFNDLKAEFCVDMVILPGGLWDYQIVWQKVAAELEVGVQQGQIEVDPTTGAITARQRHAINDRSIVTMCGGYRAYSKGTFIFDAEASAYSGANPVYTPAFGLVENKYDWFAAGSGAHAAMLYSDGVGNWYFYTEDDGDTESTLVTGDFTAQHTFEIIWEDASEYPAGPGRVRLYIDDILKATHTTAVPTHPLLFFLLMDSYIVAYSAADVWTKLHSFTVTGDT